MYRLLLLLTLVAVGTLPALGADQTADGIPLKWVGTWTAAGSEDCKELRCEIRSAGTDKWEATFTGVCNRRFSFQVKMLGRSTPDKSIRFTGKTDLGEDNGGTYVWTGDLRKVKFTGKYESNGGKRGTFKLNPAAAKNQ